MFIRIRSGIGASLLAVAATTCPWAAVQAQDRAVELPPDSRLVLASPAPGAASSAGVRFTGTTTVHAILVAQWLPGQEGDPPAPRYQLLLVPRSAAALPHVQGERLLRYIEVRNGRELLPRATSAAVAREFHARHLGVVHVEGLYTLQDLEIGQPCASAGLSLVTEADPIAVRYPPRAEPVVCPP